MNASRYIEIEKEYGKPLKALLPELMEQHGSVSAIAKALKVSQGTVSTWLKICGLKIKTILIVTEKECETA